MLIRIKEIRNLTFPDWATQNNPWNTNIYKNISTFTEGPPLLCAADQKCRHMIAGNLLGHIVRNVQEKRVGNLNASMFAYSTVSTHFAARY